MIEFAQRGLKLRHVDVPFINPKWNRQSNQAGFTSEQMKLIDGIQAPEAGEIFDICFRIAYPFNLAPSKAGQIYVFGTSENQSTSNMFVNRDPKKANKWAPNLFMITPSRWSMVGFMKAGFDEQRIKVVPHGVDPATFFPIDQIDRRKWRESIGIRDDHFVLLSLGACTLNKGVDLLVVAFAILRNKFPNLKLVLKDQSNLYGIRGEDVVSGLEKSTHRRYLNVHALDEIIYISNNLNTAELRTIYGACDCYVSSYRAEGFNLTPLEAAACGAPIIVTAGGSTDDYFNPLLGSQIEGELRSNGENTYIEPDLDSLIAKLTELIEGRRSVGGLAGSRYVHGEYSWSKVCDQLLSSMGIDL